MASGLMEEPLDSFVPTERTRVRRLHASEGGARQGARRRLPDGRIPSSAAAGKGMTAGTHGSTFGGNPLAMAAGNATLDVMLAPGFFDKLKRNALLLKQRLAEMKDRHPTVIAEIRGEGYLVGLRAVVPNGQLVDALRAEKVLAVAAGDNVLRLLPPLIASEAEIGEAIARLDRAAAALERAAERAPVAKGRPDEHRNDPPLPRPDRHSAARAAQHHRGEPRHEEARARPRRNTARWPHAGDDLRQAVDAYARLVRRGDGSKQCLIT